MPYKSKTPLEEITFLRRKLHQYPELSMKEYITQKFVLKYLQHFNFEVFTIKTGIIVYIDLHHKETIGFRTELDALPIKEETNVDFKSKNDNMHACGHDGHIAILLMLCKYIYEHKSLLKNNYLMIFQPAEEKYGGANLIANSDFFRQHLPKYLLAIHLFPNLLDGQVYYRKGPFLAMCCEIDILIKGKATHISDLDNGIDAIRIANKLIDELYFFFDKLDKNKSRFLIGKIIGGNARNVVCDNVRLYITLRNYSQEDYLYQKNKIEHIVNAISLQTSSIINIGFNDDFAPVINDSELMDKVKKKYNIQLTDRKIIGDDFSTYQKYTKTGYFLLGVNSPSFLHTNTFNFEEKILLIGLNFFIHLLNL